MTVRRQRLKAALAAHLVESGHAGEVWLALPGVARYAAKLGIQPEQIAEAISSGAVACCYFGPEPETLPGPIDPDLYGVNAKDLAVWLATVAPGRLH